MGNQNNKGRRSLAYSLQCSYDGAMLAKTTFCKLPVRAAVSSKINGHKHTSCPVVGPVAPPLCLPQALASIVLEEQILVGGHAHVRVLPKKHAFFEGTARLDGGHHFGLLHSRQKFWVRQFAPCLCNRRIDEEVKVTIGSRTGIKHQTFSTLSSYS
jgi:hypothetical protein